MIAALAASTFNLLRNYGIKLKAVSERPMIVPGVIVNAGGAETFPK